MQSLRRLHIEDWSPKAINVSAGCQGDAFWYRSGYMMKETQEWLSSPCWRAPGINLASLVVPRGNLHVVTMISVDHIHQIVECHNELERLKIGS